MMPKRGKPSPLEEVEAVVDVPVPVEVPEEPLPLVEPLEPEVVPLEPLLPDELLVEPVALEDVPLLELLVPPALALPAPLVAAVVEPAVPLLVVALEPLPSLSLVIVPEAEPPVLEEAVSAAVAGVDESVAEFEPESAPPQPASAIVTLPSSAGQRTRPARLIVFMLPRKRMISVSGRADEVIRFTGARGVQQSPGDRARPQVAG